MGKKKRIDKSHKDKGSDILLQTVFKCFISNSISLQ